MTETSKTSQDATRVHPQSGTVKTPKLETSLYMGLTASMAIQLAAVLVVGLFGGHWIDNTFSTAPIFTVIGMVSAMILMILIVRRTLQQLSQRMYKDEQ